MASRSSFLAAFSFAATIALQAGCNSRLGPDDVDSNWRKYENARFSLFVRPGSVAEVQQAALLDVLADQHAFTLSVLNINYQGRISAFMYTSAGDAKLESNYAGVAYPDTESMRAVVVSPVDGNTFALIAHEANHVIQQNALGRPGTSFMNEGLPSAVISTRFHPYGREFYWKWTATHTSQLPSLASLVDDDTWSGTQNQYNAAASFLAYLLERYGAAPIAKLYQASSAQMAERMLELYGRPLADLEADWRAFCAAHAN